MDYRLDSVFQFIWNLLNKGCRDLSGPSLFSDVTTFSLSSINCSLQLFGKWYLQNTSPDSNCCSCSWKVQYCILLINLLAFADGDKSRISEFYWNRFCSTNAEIPDEHVEHEVNRKSGHYFFSSAYFRETQPRLTIPGPPCSSSCCSDKWKALCISLIGDNRDQSEYYYSGFPGGLRCSFMLYFLNVRSCYIT